MDACAWEPGPTHFYHRGAVRLSRQRQHGAIEQARWARAWPQDAGGGAGRGALVPVLAPLICNPPTHPVQIR